MRLAFVATTGEEIAQNQCKRQFGTGTFQSTIQLRSWQNDQHHSQVGSDKEHYSLKKVSEELTLELS